MSFRSFIFACALYAGWAALVGWALGRLLFPADAGILQAGVRGLFLGMLVALGLGLVDALWTLSLSRAGQVLLRALVAAVVGCAGGFLGGVLGQSLFGLAPWKVFLVAGWTLTGVLIGGSIGVFEVVTRGLRREDARGAWRKVINGLIGGLLGGILGGILDVLLLWFWTGIFSDKPVGDLWSPSALGFVALGVCIGLLIGLVQVILKEAWVQVESGFRAGRQLILSRPETTIGRAESCDIGLFGDNSIERVHARILRQGNRYFVSDADTPTGTYLNDQRVYQTTPLQAGDVIRVGRATLRFGERQKRKAAGEK